MRRLICLLIVSICLITGCSKPPASSPSVSLTDLGQFAGKTKADVLAKLGNPDTTDQYKMSEVVGEFRVELQNTYPLTDPANAEILIQELWWYEGDYVNTLWFHQIDGQWTVLDSYTWHKDTHF